MAEDTQVETPVEAPAQTSDEPVIWHAPWEQVADTFKTAFPDVDEDYIKKKYQQVQTLNLTRQKYAQAEEKPWAWVGRRSVPFGSSAVDVARQVTYSGAIKRIQEGNPQEADYEIAASHERIQQLDAEESQTAAGGIKSGLASIPAIVGEAVLPIGTVAKGAKLGMKAVGLLGKTALMPSLWAPEAAKRAYGQGGEPWDPKNLAPAFAMGTLTNLVMGSLGESLGVGKITNAAARFVARVGGGMAEQQGIDALAGAVDEVLPEAYQTKTGYGIMGDILHGRYGDALKRATVQSVVFTAFNALHGNPKKGQEALDSTKQLLDDYAKRGFSTTKAAAALNEHMQGLHQALLNPEKGQSPAELLQESARDLVEKQKAGVDKTIENEFSAPEASKTAPPSPPEPPKAPEPPPSAPEAPTQPDQLRAGAVGPPPEAPSAPKEPATAPPAPPEARNPVEEAFSRAFPEGKMMPRGEFEAKVGDRTVYASHDPETNTVRIDFEKPKGGVGLKMEAGARDIARALQNLVTEIKPTGSGIRFRAVDTNRPNAKPVTSRAEIYDRQLQKLGYERVGTGADQDGFYTYRPKAETSPEPLGLKKKEAAQVEPPTATTPQSEKIVLPGNEVVVSEIRPEYDPTHDNNQSSSGITLKEASDGPAIGRDGKKVAPLAEAKFTDDYLSAHPDATPKEVDAHVAKMTEDKSKPWVVVASTYHEEGGGDFSRHATESEAFSAMMEMAYKFKESTGFRFRVEKRAPAPETPKKEPTAATTPEPPKGELIPRAVEEPRDPDRSNALLRQAMAIAKNQGLDNQVLLRTFKKIEAERGGAEADRFIAESIQKMRPPQTVPEPVSAESFKREPKETVGQMTKRLIDEGVPELEAAKHSIASFKDYYKAHGLSDLEEKIITKIMQGVGPKEIADDPAISKLIKYRGDKPTRGSIDYHAQKAWKKLGEEGTAWKKATEDARAIAVGNGKNLDPESMGSEEREATVHSIDKRDSIIEDGDKLIDSLLESHKNDSIDAEIFARLYSQFSKAHEKFLEGSISDGRYSRQYYATRRELEKALGRSPGKVPTVPGEGEAPTNTGAESAPIQPEAGPGVPGSREAGQTGAATQEVPGGQPAPGQPQTASDLISAAQEKIANLQAAAKELRKLAKKAGPEGREKAKASLENAHSLITEAQSYVDGLLKDVGVKQAVNDVLKDVSPKTASGLTGIVNDAIKSGGKFFQDPSGALDLNKVKETWDKVGKAFKEARAQFDELGGTMVPRMTAMARSAGEAVARMIAGRGYTKLLTPGLIDKVFGPNSDATERKLYGDVMNEWHLRHTRQAYAEKARQASNEGVALKEQVEKLREGLNRARAQLERPEVIGALKAEIARTEAAQAKAFNDASRLGQAMRDVTTVIGKEGSQIETFEQYQQLFKSPRFQEIKENWRRYVVPEMEANFKKSLGMEEDDPIHSFTQILNYPMNMLARKPGEETPTTVYTGKGGKTNFKNLKMGKNPFANERTGAADSYESDLGLIIENSMERGYGNAAKAEAIREMVAGGVARWDGPGRKEAGEREFPFTNPPKGTQEVEPGPKSLYLKEEVAKEWQKALDLVTHYKIPGVSEIASALTRTSLVSTIEATYHTANMLTSAVSAGVNPLRFFLRGAQVLGKNQEAMDRLVELAKIGAEKEYNHSPFDWKSFGTYFNWSALFLHYVNDAMRLTLDDAFTHLASRPEGLGKVPNTETARRDFINGNLGQYNIRAQNDIIVLARDLGLGPFATAGFNFAMKGLRALMGGSGVKGETFQDTVMLRAEFLGKVGLLIAAGAAWNAAKWGRADGDDNTPLGAWKLGEDEKGRTSYINPLSVLSPVVRGLRETGLLAFAEGYRKGQTSGKTIDKAEDAVLHSVMHPILGPFAQFAHVASTGKNLIGMKVAPETPYGDSEAWTNFKAAILNSNPTAATAMGWDQPGKDVPGKERLAGAFRPFAPTYRGPFAPAAVQDFKDALRADENMYMAEVRRARDKGLKEPQPRVLTVMKQAGQEIAKIELALHREGLSADDRKALRERQAAIAQATMQRRQAVLGAGKP